MNALQALNTAISHSGLTRSQVSTSTGRSRQYLTTILNRGTVPSPDAYADFADVCGYDLALIKRDGTEVLRIDPPKR